MLCTPNFVCKLESSCSYILAKNPMKIACFYDYLRKIQFLPIFYTQNDNFLIFKGVLTL